MLKSQIMNCRYNWAGSKWWRGVLDVQYIDRVASQLARKRQGDADERSMRQRLLDRKVRPTLIKALDSGLFGYVQGIEIGLIDLSERLDQVDGVTFITA
jgi:hypothetical protein